MHEGAAPAGQLAVTGAPRELAEGLHRVRHAARHAAMAEGQQPAMRVERQRPVEREVAGAQPPRGAKPVSSSRIASVMVNES